MRVMTATEVKNKLGDALSFLEDDSLLIEKNGKEAFMAFSVKNRKKNDFDLLCAWRFVAFRGDEVDGVWLVWWLAGCPGYSQDEQTYVIKDWAPGDDGLCQ